MEERESVRLVEEGESVKSCGGRRESVKSCGVKSDRVVEEGERVSRLSLIHI